MPEIPQKNDHLLKSQLEPQLSKPDTGKKEKFKSTNWWGRFVRKLKGKSSGKLKSKILTPVSTGMQSKDFQRQAEKTDLNTTPGLQYNQEEKKLLTDIDCLRPEQEAVLYSAIQSGNADRVAFLLKQHREYLWVKDEQGNLPIHLAASSGQLDILGMMVESAGPDILLAKGEGDATPLFFATQNGHVRSVEFLLSKNSKALYQGDDAGNLPVHIASALGLQSVLSVIIGTAGKSILLEKGNGGATPLHLAIQYGKKHCACFLIEQNTESLKSGNNAGNLPVHLAVKYGQLDTLKAMVTTSGNDVLLERGAGGDTPLGIAARRGYVALVNLILNCSRESLFLENEAMNTPVHVAAQFGQLDALKEMIDIAGEQIQNQKIFSAMKSIGMLISYPMKWHY